MFDLDVDPVQLECMTQALYHEARGEESYIGKLLVGFVVKERIEDPYYNDTYCGVIIEPAQFSFYEGEFKPMYEIEQSEYLSNLAYIVMTTPSPVPECLTMYHADYVLPDWDFDKLDFYGQYGSHKFYVELDCLTRRGISDGV